MNKINLKTIAVTSALALATLLMFTGFTQAATFNMLTAQLDYGQTSTNVTNLQIFLASDPSIYPQGLVTGYFGSLTKSAVMNFQNRYGIEQVGRVGPATLAQINSLIASGNGMGSGADVNAAVIFAPSVSPSSNGAIISWATNEATTAQVYYSNASFQFAEAINNSSEPTIIGGTATPRTSSLQVSQNVSLQGLQSNTMYFYMIESTDSSGNLSYTWPQTFRTN